MNTEWIYLALYGLVMIVCCYHMTRMMKGSDASEQTDTERAGAETVRAGAETVRASAKTTRVDAETADALPPKTN